MAETKTHATTQSAADFIAAIPDPVRRADAETLVTLFEATVGEPATMWGPTIVGFGRYRYTYESGRSGEMCRIGFSPRKAEQVLYVLSETLDQSELLARLGKHRTGKSCLYVRRLSDIDMAILQRLVEGALAHMDAKYPRS